MKTIVLLVAEIINEQTDLDVSNNKTTNPRSLSTLDEGLNASFDSNVCYICLEIMRMTY